MSWWLYLIPVIGACIGWVMNRLLITFLFHPGRQRKIFTGLGKIAAKELFSFSDIRQKIASPENFKMIRPQVEIHVDEFLRIRLKQAFPWIGSMIGDRTINDLKGLFMTELERIFPLVMEGYIQNLEQELDLEQLITSKLASISTRSLEEHLYREIGAELRMVTVFGAIGGFVTGLLALLAVYIVIR